MTYKDEKLPTEERVNDLLGNMTLEEKIAQMDLWTISDSTSEDVLHEVETWGLGGFLCEVPPERNNELQELAAKQRLQIPLLFQIDACHGNAMVEGATVFPTNISMAATFDKTLGYELAREAAKEIRWWGQGATYTPTIDVTIEPRFGRSGETFGECPHVTSEMADAYVRGLQGDLTEENAGVAACPKHFIGGGASIGGCNHASAEISMRTLRETFLPPFKKAIDAGALMIMAGHNDINGIPSHAHHELLTTILKEEWGFQGFVVSDMCDVAKLHGPLQNVAASHDDALVMGINAGIDMYMNSRSLDDFMKPMKRLVEDGRITMDRIDDAVRRILRVKFMLGLFENCRVDTERAADAFGAASAKRTALEAARDCMTLMTNDDLLPLTPGAHKRVLVTGPNAGNQAILGDWARPQEHTVTIEQGVRDFLGDNAEVEFFDCGRQRGKPFEITMEMAETADLRILEQEIKDNKGEISEWSIAEAVKRAETADLIVLALGGYAIRTEWGLRTYGESCTTPDLCLFGEQLELAKALHATGKPVVVVLVSGKVVCEPWIYENVPAVLFAWEPGEFGGQAVAEVIWGKVNPSGRLPITFPQSEGHIPQFYYQRQSRYWTGYVGRHGSISYPWGDVSPNNAPAFPFGHGLSYTTFEYSGLRVPETVAMGMDVPVSITVTNTGNRAGREAVLLYLRDVVATISPAIKLLKGFDKIHLEPGESKQVEFVLTPDDLSLWNVAMERIVEPGDFNIMIGDHAATVTVRVAF